MLLLYTLCMINLYKYKLKKKTEGILNPLMNILKILKLIPFLYAYNFVCFLGTYKIICCMFLRNIQSELNQNKTAYSNSVHFDEDTLWAIQKDPSK